MNACLVYFASWVGVCCGGFLFVFSFGEMGFFKVDIKVCAWYVILPETLVQE